MYSFRRLSVEDLVQTRDLLKVFAESFQDPNAYLGNPPIDAYLQKLLANPQCVVLAGFSNQKVVGGLIAYELKKLEQERSEIYIYDLAVDEKHRRHGVATGLITELKTIAKKCGAYVIYVQADKVDAEAIDFYRSITNHQEDVFHFDITVA
jgi:aminoglycoside 3-N-acetyltransferase I